MWQCCVSRQFQCGKNKIHKRSFLKVVQISLIWWKSPHDNSNKSICIDLISNDCQNWYMAFRFSEMLVTVIQTSYQRIDHKIKHYCNSKDICNDIINESLHHLFQQNWNSNCDKGVDKFFLSYSKVLDKYAPRRKKYMLSLIISCLWIKVRRELLCDEKTFQEFS